MLPTNPFLINRCEPRRFCDREAERQSLADAANRGRPVLLNGRQDIGKTHLLRRLFAEPAVADAFLCVLADLQLAKDFASVVHAIAKALLRQLPRPLVMPLTTAVPSIRFDIELNPDTGAAAVGCRPSDVQNAGKALTEILAFLSSLNQRVLLALDGAASIDCCQAADTEALTPLFRKDQRISKIFTIRTSAPSPRLEALLPAETLRLTIGPLEQPVYRRFAQQLFTEGGRTLTDAAFDELYQRLAGNTCAIHFVLKRLFDATPVGGSAETAIRPEVLLPVLASHEDVFRRRLKRLPVKQQLLVTVFAIEQTVEKPTSRDFLQRNGLPAPSTVQSALKSLQSKSLLEKTTAGWRLVDRLFEIWLRHRLDLPF